MRRIYLRIRALVDYDLKHNSRPASPFLGLLPPIVLGAAGVERSSVTGGILWLVVVAVCAVWTGFGFWRIFRLSRASVLRGDRDYDRRVKFWLSPEYRQTESATAARRRRRRSAGQ